ncbi:MAG: hypothetical protein K5866_05380 [Treponema sp.]|nr:hypothetical protein [Treponema sp.]
MGEKFYEKFTAKKDDGKKNSKKNSKRDLNKSFAGDKREKTWEPKKSQKKIDNFASKSKGDVSRVKKGQGIKANHTKEKFSYQIKNSLFAAKKLEEASNNILLNFDKIVQSLRPMNSKQAQQLPENIKELSHQLTDQRASRRLGYMNEKVQLSAYVNYYTWWNLVRLTKLFSNLPEKSFPNKDCLCLDLGSGPLTLVTALWLARPELRKLNLTWYCLDLSSNSMAFGEDIYLSIAAKTGDGHHWNIIRVKGSFGTSIKEKVDFLTCANMFNELDQNSDMPPEFQSKKYFDQLKNYASPEAKFLLVEPGIPKATRTIALLRERFVKDGKELISPCPQADSCPMNGFKAYTGSQNKWCNFSFATNDAPEKLLKLSEKAKLPKERATLIFISIAPMDKGLEGDSSLSSLGNSKEQKLLIRITSDPFRMPGNKTGYYACSKLGLTLVIVNKAFNFEEVEKNDTFTSGDLLEVKIKSPDFQLEKDEKSGALKIELE